MIFYFVESLFGFADLFFDLLELLLIVLLEIFYLKSTGTETVLPSSCRSAVGRQTQNLTPLLGHRWLGEPRP
ncbi:Hypothetical predicted protein [Scomber scombrus]|uniref:Uncharacterized protein n=1 Tax=Scomber scombrus TaxID=13677 RepID=A0AAV1Q7V5_SCOSC